MSIDLAITWLRSLNANDWAIFATWIGTILSACSLWGISKLRAYHIAKLRLPQLHKDLKKAADKLSGTLIDASLFEEKSGVFHEHAVIVMSILHSISDKAVPRTLRSQVKTLASTIKKEKADTWRHPSAFEIYTSVRSVEAALDQIRKDMEA